jgi:hypothetical protein
LLAILGLALPGCGDSTPAPETAHEAKKPAPEKAERTESTEAEETPESAPRAACEDGACFECGSGTCPQAWYCDENAPGGAACSWLPECSKKLDCACVGKALGKACSCAEADGGLHVKCK